MLNRSHVGGVVLDEGCLVEVAELIRVKIKETAMGTTFHINNIQPSTLCIISGAGGGLLILYDHWH